MYLSFADDDLRMLCNSGALLRRRFGERAALVELRLTALSNAKVLGDITMRPPDRRRTEPDIGPAAASVCARDAGRIYFQALGLSSGDASDWEQVDQIEIFAIGETGQ